MKRYLALTEGYSDDVHYGKTTFGVIRYAPDPVVAVLDSTRAGETMEGGIPIVGTVAEALVHEPTVALVGVAVAGGRLPPVWRGIRSSRRSPQSTASNSATTGGRRPT